jgi:hypothetical protein
MTVPQSPMRRSFWLVNILTCVHRPGSEADASIGGKIAFPTWGASSSDKIAHPEMGAASLFPSVG